MCVWFCHIIEKQSTVKNLPMENEESERLKRFKYEK